MTFRFAALALIPLIAWPILGDEPPLRPLLTLRLDRPDREAGRLIALFDGAKAADPAQALAAWKRSSREPKRLGKPLEAALAAINPRMAGELRSLDGARVVVRSWPRGQAPRWYATLPRDDGTFAALGSALVLSGGAEEPPAAGVAVDRLGPPGSALMARGPRALVVAGTRDDLEAGLDDPGPVAADLGDRPTWDVEIHPGAMDPSANPALTVPMRLLRAAGCRVIGSASGLEGTAFRSTSVVELGPGPIPASLRLDPAWLDLVPRDDASAAFALALDPGALDALFGVADRFANDDPARAAVAPSRLRLGLLARAIGIRVEADILPHLRGVSGWVGASPGRPADRGVVAVHFGDEAAAARVLATIRADGSVSLDRRGASILVGWGRDPIGPTRVALDHPDRSAGPLLRSDWDGTPPARAGGLWPGRMPGLVPDGSPLAAALAEAPPVAWSGRNEGATLRDRLRWAGLDATVRRFLDLIPLDPPPDR